MTRNSLCLALVLLLFVCACPQQREGESPGKATGDGNHEPKSMASSPIAEPDHVIVWSNPVLKEPLRALASQVSDSMDQDLLLVDAGVDDIAALEDNKPPQMPQIVIYADPSMTAQFAAAGIIIESTARTFAGDRLVLVQKEGRGFSTPTLFDTYKLRFTKLGYLDESTALGRASHQALVSDGLLERIEDRTATYGSIQDLIDAMLAEEIELAVLPASLATQSEGLEPIHIIGEDLHEDIRYVAAASEDSGDIGTVLDILRLLAEDQQLQEMFTGYGLVDRATALEEN